MLQDNKMLSRGALVQLRTNCNGTVKQAQLTQPNAQALGWPLDGREIGSQRIASSGRWLNKFLTMFRARKTWAGFSSVKAGLLKQSPRWIKRSNWLRRMAMPDWCWARPCWRSTKSGEPAGCCKRLGRSRRVSCRRRQWSFLIRRWTRYLPEMRRV